MKYRKKTVEIEAIQWNGLNIEEIFDFFGEDNVKFTSVKEPNGDVYLVCQITTLKGIVIANINDYIIKGVRGEVYPCKPNIFKQTYEKVE